MVSLEWWGYFAAIVILLLAFDIGFVNRKPKEIPLGKALKWSIFWISVAIIFNIAIWINFGSILGMEFLSAYLIEESLSIDNLFVFLMIFSAFEIDPKFQHKILFWGVIGAIIMRLIFIMIGVSLIEHFSWMLYVFGGFLVISGVKMLKSSDSTELENNRIYKFLTKHLHISSSKSTGAFFIKENGKLVATTIFLVLLIIEISDLIFALDSIPAVLSISSERFIIYSSNIFAILGLRSLYFALSGVMKLFTYLKYGLSAILIFIGFKMLLMEFIHVPIFYSLLVMSIILSISVIASLCNHKKKSMSNVT